MLCAGKVTAGRTENNSSLFRNDYACRLGLMLVAHSTHVHLPLLDQTELEQSP